MDRSIGAKLQRGVQQNRSKVRRVRDKGVWVAWSKAEREPGSRSRAFRKTLSKRGGALGKAINKNIYGTRVAAKKIFK